MSQRLIHQLSELKSVKQAPALWRAQTRERLLSTIAVSTSRDITLAERFSLMVQEVRLTFAPARLVPVLAVLVVLAVGAAPFGRAVLASVPGDNLYGAKRMVERIELTLKSSPTSQGLLHLAFASRRLGEAQAVPAATATLLRDYNIDLGFAQAALATAPISPSLASAYDHGANQLGGALSQLKVDSSATQAYGVAVGLTDQLAGESLALLVGAHTGGSTAVPSQEVADRLSQEIAKVSQKLDTVDTKLQQFPGARVAPRVVLERKQAIVPAKEASSLAQQSLTEAKQLVEKKEFTLALQKVQESEEITQKTEAAVDKATDASVPSTSGTSATPTGEVKGDATVVPAEDKTTTPGETPEQPAAGAAPTSSADKPNSGTLSPTTP